MAEVVRSQTCGQAEVHPGRIPCPCVVANGCKHAAHICRHGGTWINHND